MRTFSKNQSGFGAIPVVAAIVVIAVVATSGWLVYNHNHKTNKSESSTTSTQTVSKDGSLTDNAQQVQAANQELSIKEWGIQIPLTSSIQDAYYVVSNSSQDSSGQPDTMWLSLTSLNNSGCNASLANQGQSTQLGAILRVSPTGSDPVSGTSYTQLYPNGTTIGSYYYAYKSLVKNKTCTSQANLQNIDSAFATAVKSATASN